MAFVGTTIIIAPQPSSPPRRHEHHLRHHRRGYSTMSRIIIIFMVPLIETMSLKSFSSGGDRVHVNDDDDDGYWFRGLSVHYTPHTTKNNNYVCSSDQNRIQKRLKY